MGPTGRHATAAPSGRRSAKRVRGLVGRGGRGGEQTAVDGEDASGHPRRAARKPAPLIASPPLSSDSEEPDERSAEVAGEKIVAVASPSIVQQCLNAGLLDGIRVSLIPVLLGRGVPYFDGLAMAPIQLHDPALVQGDGVTHLYYRVRRRTAAPA